MTATSISWTLVTVSRFTMIGALILFLIALNILLYCLDLCNHTIPFLDNIVFDPVNGQLRLADNSCPLSDLTISRPQVEATLDALQQSELKLLTLQECGLLGRNAGQENTSITDLITKRERGMKNGLGFSRPERCRINNFKLPAQRNEIDTYEQKAFCSIYSHDGTKILTASQDRYLRIYENNNTANYKLAAEIQGRDVGWSILDVAFSPDDQMIAYSSWSSYVHLVSLRGETRNHASLPLCPEERRFCIFSLKFSSDGRDILCGANDGHIYIYDMSTNDRTMRAEAHDDDVNIVGFADDNCQIIYSGGDDGFCKVWDRRTLNESSPKPVGILAGHIDGVTYMDTRGDARYLLSNSKDQSLKIWDIRMFSSKSAQDHTKKVLGSVKWDYRWQRAPKRLVTKRPNKADSSVATYRGHSVLQTLIRCHFSPAFTTGQRYVYTGCAHGRVMVYDILTGEVPLKLFGHTSVVRDVSWHPYRPEIISSSWDNSVLIWNHEVAEGDVLKKDDLTLNSKPLRRSERIAQRLRHVIP